MYFLPIHNPTSQQRRGFLASRKMTGSVHAATINIDNGFIYFSQFFSGGRLTDLLVLSVLSIFTLTYLPRYESSRTSRQISIRPDNAFLDTLILLCCPLILANN